MASASLRGSRRVISSGNMTFSSTVFHGSNWSNSWKIIIRSAPGSDISRPEIRILPSLGVM